MAMPNSVGSITALICPNCGAGFQIKPGQRMSFCSFCGTQLLVDDGTRTQNINVNKTVSVDQRTTSTQVDQAEIERQKTEQMRLQLEYQKEMDKRKRRFEEDRYWLKVMIGFIVVGWLVIWLIVKLAG